MMPEDHRFEIQNNGFRLSIQKSGRQVLLVLQDAVSNFMINDGAYLYQASITSEEGEMIFKGLGGVSLRSEKNDLFVCGTLAGLEVEHHFRLSSENLWLEERIQLFNRTTNPISLTNFFFGMRRRLTDEVGNVLPELIDDHFQAIPFLHRPTDPINFDWDFDIPYLLTHAGREAAVCRDLAPFSEGHGFKPSNQHPSEGWAWHHADRNYGIFKFSQETMEFSVLAVEPLLDGVYLRFGGTSLVSGEPSALFRIEPGQCIQLGTTRYITCLGGYEQVSYAFRQFLDEKGCKFPPHYNPPVHWNELYDTAEWSLDSPGQPSGPRFTRPKTYTKELILLEAEKASAYLCQALYLDPGWDTDFATFIWGNAWLGDRSEFIDEIKEKYGLSVALHTPLATWLSSEGRSIGQWPESSWRMDVDGNIIPGSICLGSSQYLDEAEKRLLDLCAGSVVFLMFDGNWYNGGCWNPNHRHPIPYTKEAHCLGNLELARRIHSKYPQVLIEMHDMITGGCDMRYTPVYYKYGLPGSYDDNWGFELMWQPLEDLRSGRARALYYYNLACNIPIYLHIDLRDDNQHCLALWWFASTCRHLGIGGTNENRAIVNAQIEAMKRYRKLEAFFKRGDFYGLSEEVHLHVLPSENAFVVNLFNLSETSTIIKGEVKVEELGLDPNRWYVTPRGGTFITKTGCFRMERRLEPWSAQVVEVKTLE